MRVKTPDLRASDFERIVKCPACSGPSVYSQSNTYRPFCSSRCKKVDLGAWASEQFALPQSSDPNLSDADLD